MDTKLEATSRLSPAAVKESEGQGSCQGGREVEESEGQGSCQGGREDEDSRVMSAMVSRLPQAIFVEHLPLPSRS